MKFSSKFRTFAALAAALIFAGTKTGAQTFGLNVTSSADSILVSNSLTYTITVTNLAGLALPDTQVTNVLPASVQFVSAAPGVGSFTNYGSVGVFDLGLFNASIVQMTLTVEPTAAGFITNIVTVAAPSLLNSGVSTNLITQVTNAVLPSADLGVTLTGPAQPTNIVNDLVAFAVTATNAGPDDAPNVFLTNTFPPGAILVSPANQIYSGGNLIFSLGTLVAGGSTNFQFTIQPTNAGVLNFSASIGAAGSLDTNSANNSASENIVVTNYFPGQLLAVTNSAQSVNLVNGLTEQSVLVSNTGSNAVAAVRVVVAGLAKQLFNAVGTNNGSPFVVYPAALATNQSVNLVLQFFPRGSFPFINGQLQAFAVPPPDLAPPAVLSASTNLNLTRVLPLSNGDMLVEFMSTPGLSYTVVYADNMSFSNAMIAPPSVVAPANVVQWLDYGPPATVSVPATAGVRYYRVFQNP